MSGHEPVVRRRFLERLGAISAATAGIAVVPVTALGQSRGSERGLSVKSFGAKGDNAADDTAAIRKAIASASSSRRFVVYFPAGNYRITGTIKIPEGVMLVGDGLDMSTIRHSGASSALTAIGTAKAQVVKTSIRDMSIFGDGVASDVGLDLWYGPYGFYQNIRVHGFRIGVSVRDSWCLTFEQVSAESARQDGWSFGRDANNIGMRNCVGLKNARAGYSISGPRGLVLLDCNAEENGTGVIIAANGAQRTEKISILGGYYEGNASEEVFVRSDDGKVIPKAVTVRDAYFVRVDNARHSRGVAIRVRDVTTLVIDGCHFSGRGDGYRHSLHLPDGGNVSGVVWGIGNLDESASGRFKGARMTYSTVGEIPA